MDNGKKIMVGKRDTAFVNLKDFCIFAGNDDSMEFTEWTNGEGFDVTLSARDQEKMLSFTYGEFDALAKMKELLAGGQGE